MAVRYYRKDPRSGEEKRADDELLRRFRKGEVLQVAPASEREAIDYVQRRHQMRRDLVAALGKELGVLRRAHGLTQEEVACAVGTAKSNISRLESGRYGGLTVERFVAVLDAFEALGRRARQKPEEAGGHTSRVLPSQALHRTRPARRPAALP
jgi:transcriptional regulator with XRE-family HTH domain